MITDDVYYLWLGISREEHPPNHYRLLGIPLFEQNTDVIRNAADRQLGHVKRLAVNQYTQVGQKLLDEIAAAKLCLLKPDKRAAYDIQLRGWMNSRGDAKPTVEVEVPLSLPAGETSRNTQSASGLTVVAPEAEAAEQELIVGRDSKCDIIIDAPAVSGMHCKLVRRANTTYIKDLRSTNGTYVNLKRTSSLLEITPKDWITLGRSARLKPPPTFFPLTQRSYRVFFVGRHAACEIRRDINSVSVLHARIILDDKDVFLEDLDSTNGTSVLNERGENVLLRPNSPLNVTDCKAVSFGDCKVDLSELLMS